MGNDHDPRIFFAAERTLLAWLRTGITIIGLGFVVSKLGLLLRVISNSSMDTNADQGAAAIGIMMVLFGGITVVGAARQHWRFCQTLHENERPANYWVGFAHWISMAVTISAIMLAIFLIIT